MVASGLSADNSLLLLILIPCLSFRLVTSKIENCGVLQRSFKMTISKTIETGTLVSTKLKRPFHWNVINGQSSMSPEPQSKKIRSEHLDFQKEERTLSSSVLPAQQKVLLLHGKGHKYEIQEGYAIPNIKDHRELLIKIQYIGLNPIDWKSA
jgi:hypothetical protein